MTRKFIAEIGYDNFIKEAKDTFALQEIGRFYDNPMDTKAQVVDL